MGKLPSDTVTFLFTDIEGSTKLAQEHSGAMPAFLAFQIFLAARYPNGLPC